MKKIALLLCGCGIFMFSCTRNQEEKKVSPRDYSITKSNSYSDLFLDSLKMEEFISAQKLNDSIANQFRSFYNTRNYEYAWFNSNGLTQQAQAFWNLHEYYSLDKKDSLSDDKKLKTAMDELLEEDSTKITSDAAKAIDIELKLTRRYLNYMRDNYEEGKIKKKQLAQFVPIKKQTLQYAADSLLKNEGELETENQPYVLLKKELQKYVDIEKNGGWKQIDPSIKALKKNTSSPVVSQIKKRLAITGQMPAGDTSALFDDTLVEAIKSFQVMVGHTPDGEVHKSLVEEMNIPVSKRIEQLVINLDRQRWAPTQPEGKLIIVNIPEFKVHVTNDGKQLFSMDVVVGKEGHGTTMFTGNLNEIVFSPYWNIPVSIVKSEILPAMEKNPGYLASRHMEETGRSGGIPQVRQLPGPWNSLGRVKFLFPNSFDIYFHDTNAKYLFEKDNRAYSHGCIRLADPVKMAEFLLEKQPEWTPEKIKAAMGKMEPTHVALKEKVPVFITYFTAWVDNAGKLNFRKDIYNHDSDLARWMFTQ